MCVSDNLLNNPLVAEAVVLEKVCYAKAAEYRHTNHQGCLQGTREEILDEIELWTLVPHSPPVYWLNGLAGMGKTSIALTVAKRAFAGGQLGASFFCSRDFEDRSNLQLIFPTIAVQLARAYPQFRSIFIPLVRSDPDVVYESLYGQMEKLIVQPLVTTAISTTIVIDALDECRHEDPDSVFLSVLGKFVTKMPKVKFFITGRPEPHIRDGFQLQPLAETTNVFILHRVELSQVNSDIQLFFMHNFSELKSRRGGLANWPTKEQLDLLCKRADGFFVYAMATVRFIGQGNSNPKRQLDHLLQVPQNTVFEGRAKLGVNQTLDILYMTILDKAFKADDVEHDPKIQSVLGAVILATNPLSPNTIATLLTLDIEDVTPLLSAVHSLLVIPEGVNHPVRPFHKSFPDFITDSTRCTNPRFCISPTDQHKELLVACLRLMNQVLDQNMCDLPDGVANSDVPNLKERSEQHLDPALQYACKSWHKHLKGTGAAHLPFIVPVLHLFLEKRFLFWLEVLSVLGATKEAVDALEVAAKLLDVCSVSLFVFEALT